MAGGLIELLSKNTEDVFLTSDPKFSYFKIVYYRYTNFSLETKEYTINTNFGKNNNFQIPTDGDLVKNIFLQIELPLVTQEVVDLETLKWEVQNIQEVPDIKSFIKEQKSTYVISEERKIEFISKTQTRLFTLLKKDISNYPNIEPILRDCVSIIENKSSLLNTNKYETQIIKDVITYYSQYTVFASFYKYSYATVLELFVNLILNILNKIIQASIALKDVILNYDIIKYSNGTILKVWKTYIEGNEFNNLLNTDPQYIDVNIKFLQSFISINYNLENAIYNLNNQILIDFKITDISLLYSNFQGVISISLEKIVSELVEYGYEFNYVNYVTNIIRSYIDTGNISLSLVKQIYSEYFPTSLITVLYDNYLSSDTFASFELKYLNEYYKIFVKYFVAIYTAVTSKAELVNVFPQFSSLTPIIEQIKGFYTNTNTITLIENIDRIYEECNQIFNDTGRAFYYFYNYGYVFGAVDDLTLNNSTIDGFKNEFILNVIQLENSITFYQDYLTYETIYSKFDFNNLINKIIYEDNTDIIIEQISIFLGRELTQNELDKSKEYILNYNYSLNASYKLQLIELLGIDIEAVNQLFADYPYQGFRFQLKSPKDNKLEQLIILNSYLNDIFLEESYYEYVFKKKELIDFKINLDFGNLSQYERILLNSFYFFNLDYLTTKVPQLTNYLTSLYTSTNWRNKIKFINILSLADFKNYIRTNEKAAIQLYNEWVQKINGTKTWQSLVTVSYNGINSTHVEIYYAEPKFQEIKDTYNEQSYGVYLELLATENYQNFKYTIDNFGQNRPIRVIFDLGSTLTELGSGRYYTEIVITRFFLRPMSRLLIYGKPYHKYLLKELINDTNETLEYNSSYLKNNNISRMSSFIIEEHITSGVVYKDTLLNISNIDVISNDIKINISTNTLERVIPDKYNFYAYFEALLWLHNNDYAYLVKEKKRKSEIMTGEFPTNLPIRWVDKVGHRLIEACELYIGDLRIDMFDSGWMDLYQEYFQNQNHRRGYNKMIGNSPEFTNSEMIKSPKKITVPLTFWFSRNNTTALPIIALTNTKVWFKFKFNGIEKLLQNYNRMTTKVGVLKCKILLDFVYLDLDERKKFIRQKHNYLINQLKVIREPVLNTQNTINFRLKNPVIDIFLLIRDKNGKIYNKVQEIELITNGVSFNKVKDPELFSLITPYQKYFSSIDGVLVFSFALFPTNIQPSGSLNFHYIVNSFFKYVAPMEDHSQYSATIYAREYNILQVMSGQASLIFN